MARDDRDSVGPFRWSGGWFGLQLGSTVWMLIEGLLIMRRDPLSGLVTLGGCGLLNAWGFFLWNRRERWPFHGAMQSYLALMSIVYAIVIPLVKSRGADRAMTGWVSTEMPEWVIFVGPVLMAGFFVMRLALTRRHREVDD